MSTFRTVLSFEVLRTLRKKSFWIGALAVPVLAAVIVAVQLLSAQSASDAAEAQASAEIDFVYLDESGRIDASIASGLGGSPVSSAESGLAEVRAGEVDAFFHYPPDPTTAPVEVAGVYSGVVADGRYGAVATSLLSDSARAAVGSPELVELVTGGFQVQTTTYMPDGSVSTVLAALPIGILIIVLFFLVVVLLGNPVLIATTEEKENRVAEVLLTSARPDTVISAKLTALGIIGLTQMLVVIVPVTLVWALFREQLSIGGLDLRHIVLDPGMIAAGVLILLGASALYVATLAAVGAAAPSAKEAGGFTFVAILLPLAPLYASAAIVATPGIPLVQVLTYFPLTAGTTALLRNAVGSLALWEGLIVAAILFVTAALVLQLAVRAFRRGALEYDRRLRWREIFERTSTRPTRAIR